MSTKYQKMCRTTQDRAHRTGGSDADSHGAQHADDREPRKCCAHDRSNVKVILRMLRYRFLPPSLSTAAGGVKAAADGVKAYLGMLSVLGQV